MLSYGPLNPQACEEKQFPHSFVPS